MVVAEQVVLDVLQKSLVVIHHGSCSGSSGSCTGLAAKATADADGNAIKTTYLKLSSGTMTGSIVMNNKAQLSDSNTLA